ncbi:MAG: fatty acid desaturase family protein [Bdellovibrionales bacterium]
MATLSEQANNIWIYLLAVLVIAGRQHGLFIMVHEGVHKHLAARKRWNDRIANWLAAYPVLFDMDTYRETHYRHHEHLNTDKDPDWIRKKDLAEWNFPVTKAKIAAFLPYFMIFAGLKEWCQIVLFYSGLTRRETFTSSMLRKRLIKKTLFFALAATIITALHGWSMVFLYWIAPLFLVFPLLQRIRSVGEHFGLPREHELNSSRDITSGPLENSLFSPHNVNLHLCHHLYPAIPSYNLPTAHRTLMQKPNFAASAHVNDSYVLFGKSVLRDLTSSSSTASAAPGSPERIDLSKAS